MGLKDLFSSTPPPTPPSPPAPAEAAAPAAAAPASGPKEEASPPPKPEEAPKPPPGKRLETPAGTPAGTATDALNSAAVQAVQFANSETAGYAPSQVAIGPNMMISQASGLVAQAGANYFDGASKLALASKSILLKDMTEKFAKENLKGAAEDALGILITDLLVGTAAAIAAAAGAIEGEAAHLALDKIDKSLDKYQDLMGKKAS